MIKKTYFNSFVVFTLLSASALIFTGCSDPSASASQQDLPAVQVIKVASTGSTGLMASGKVAPYQSVQVVSKIAGKIAEVKVDEGSKVTKGQTLIQLESDDYVQQVRQARAGISGAEARLADLKAGTRSQQIAQLQSGVDQAKASLDTAQKTYDRMKSLFDSGAISQADLDKVALDLERAKSGYDQAKAQLDLAQEGATPASIQALAAEVERSRTSLTMAETALANTAIKAPIDGEVVNRTVDPGEMAQPGVALMTVVSMNKVKVEASVPQEQINQVKKGSQVSVKVDGMPDKTFQGTVDFISPVSDQNSSTFPVKVVVDNPDGLLKAGMVAQVYFTDKPDEQRIELPASALLAKDGKTYVFKVDAGVVHQAEVSTEPKNADWVYVKSGVQNGEQIVLNPGDQLTDGSSVRVE
ncbi:efflux RND transporter periplasmic adaptor subunit [Brevibacillus massiliensis]|uniref:efflux RND transporter periplasmic adaptor subunit n=1 Tax=Brevibacillus massiliensis TaxID=1118054 RepID=UPI0003150334|nr:efflux RND transporter periplasmic adaptor subunit [Brevibacillus massiliensis]